MVAIVWAALPRLVVSRFRCECQKFHKKSIHLDVSFPESSASAKAMQRRKWTQGMGYSSSCYGKRSSAGRRHTAGRSVGALEAGIYKSSCRWGVEHPTSNFVIARFTTSHSDGVQTIEKSILSAGICRDEWRRSSRASPIDCWHPS